MWGGEASVRLRNGDIIPLPVCAWEAVASALRARVVVEVKRSASLLDKLIDEMRGCPDCSADQHAHGEHNKCRALAVLRPQYFLGVAAGEAWRLFTVTTQTAASLGEELSSLDSLSYAAIAHT